MIFILPPNTTVDEIHVRLNYDPGPTERTKQPGRLIVTACGFGDWAEGDITFYNPP